MSNTVEETNEEIVVEETAENATAPVKKTPTTTEVSVVGASEADGKIDPKILKILANEPKIPLTPINDGVIFQGVYIQDQPHSFKLNRRNIRYVASDDPKIGDRLAIQIDGWDEEREFRMGGEFIRSFTQFNDLKNGRWFLGRFDAGRREDMATHLIQDVLDNREFTLFHEKTTDGDFLINMVPDRRPVLSDVDVLQVVESVLGSDADIQNFVQGKYSISFQVVTKTKANIAPEGADEDNIVLGLQVQNSQVGLHGPKVAVYMLRENTGAGLTRTEKEQSRAWSQSDRDDSINNSDLKAWYQKAIQKEMAKFESNIKKIRETTTKIVSPTTLGDIVTEYHLGKKHQAAIEDAYKKELAESGDPNGHTIFRLGAAIIRAGAEGNFDFDTQIRLESIGGELLLSA